MNWKMLKAFPKYALVFAVFFGSSGLFAVWWYWFYPASKPQADTASAAISSWASDWSGIERRKELQKKAATLPERMGWLALVDRDLYDISTGELLFKDFIGGVPQRLFYQPEVNRLMAQTDRGILRFAMDGSKEAVLGGDAPPSFTHDGKQATFVKDGDIWVADMDWKGFCYVNERQVTHLGQFSAPFYAANVILGSEKAVIVKANNALLRVNLLTGDVEPIVLTLSDLGKRRSPDGTFLVGEHNGQIYAYDVNTKDAVMLPKGRDAILDWQWLNNQQCAFIVAGIGVGLYDREKSALEEVAALPFPCNKISGPSPDGRFVLCSGRQGVVIVDVKEKKAEPFGAPAQHYVWVSDDALIYSRNVPDMSVRGTWLRRIGMPEKLAMSEPYNFGRDGIGAVGSMREVNTIILGINGVLFKMELHGAELRQVARLSSSVLRIEPMGIWGIK